MTITLHTDADTKLRDAAPDLAEALKQLEADFVALAKMNKMPPVTESIKAARAALAKAGL